MSTRSGGQTSDDEKHSRSHSHQRTSSDNSGRKRSAASCSSNPAEESNYERKRSRRREESRETYHRSSHKNWDDRGNRRPPRSRSRSRERYSYRTSDKYSNYDGRSHFSGRRSTDRANERTRDRDDWRYRGRRNEQYTGSRVSEQSGERNHPVPSEQNSRTSYTDARGDGLRRNPAGVSSTETQIKIGVPGVIKLVEEVEKRKLLFNKKERPAEATQSKSSTVWDHTKFSEDSDGKMTAKFKRLMGIKDEGPPSVSNEPVQKTITATNQDEYFADLEKQYEVARATTHTQRGVGLGFSSLRTFPLKPKP